jgi:hypothetical protein
MLGLRSRKPRRDRGAVARRQEPPPRLAYSHLVAARHQLPAVGDARAARISLLEQMEVPWPTQEQYQPLGGDLLTLLHSYAHRTIRILIVKGIDAIWFLKQPVDFQDQARMVTHHYPSWVEKLKSSPPGYQWEQPRRGRIRRKR